MSAGASTSSPSELDLGEFLDREAGKLSAGQKTRVALAKALINAPELLLLDEPTASLDPDTGDWIRTRLETYRERRGATILLASHNMPEVERLCDDVIMMKAGRIVDRAAPERADRQSTAAPRSRTSSSTSRAGAASPGCLAEPAMNAPFARRRPPVYRAFSVAADRRHGAPLPLSHALVLAAARSSSSTGRSSSC